MGNGRDVQNSGHWGSLLTSPDPGYTQGQGTASHSESFVPVVDRGGHCDCPLTCTLQSTSTL